MAPLPSSEWKTDITLGSIADLSTTCRKRIEQMILREIPRPDSVEPYSLKWPLKITLEFEQEIITAVNEDLDLFAYGTSEKECLNNFYSMFDDMKKHYAELTDSEVIGHAVRLKALFSSIA
jgi:hypothetical protein